MKLTGLLVVLLISVGASQAQFGGFRGFFHGASNFFQPMQHMFHHHVARPVSHFMPHFRMPFFGSNGGHHHGHQEDFRSNGVGNTRDKATKEPQANGIDKLYPDDCGRDDKNKGLLCFPDGQVCAESTCFK